MKRFLAGLLLALPSTTLLAQGNFANYADDAYRFSDFTQSGTARFRGTGGNQVALGGDASNITGNPAGLGFYNRSEFSLSPSLNFNSTTNRFLNNTRTADKTNVNIGNLSLVFAGERPRSSEWRRSSFGISYSQNSNFSTLVDAQGTNQNNNSTFINEYLIGLNSGGPQSVREQALSQDFTWDKVSSVATARTPEAAAYGLFLISPTFYGGETTQENGSPFFIDQPNVVRNQRLTQTQTGANSQWTFAYAGNLQDKLYLGISGSIASLRYDMQQTLRESPINGDFDNYGRTDQLTVRGTGFNLTAGAIYRPVQSFQVGLSASTPTFYQMKETFSQSLFAFGRSQTLRNKLSNLSTVNVDPNDFEYSLTTPFRASGGFTYFLGGGKIGFITATADYVAYRGMRTSTDYADTQTNEDFTADVRQVVQDTYQNVVNLRAGAEIRASILRLRAGIAYLPSAYRIDLDRVNSADRSRTVFSGGVGVRNDRFFADVSGSYYTTKQGLSPYYLNDADTPTVATSNARTNVMLSLGLFF
ncbi:hypothetical protein ACAW74_19155 [Fibrella sp. WM1]|uniref:hypothetical protein n=1 Tax=Fibrella musci TaxID=3242485 RepID=UPI003522D657